MDLIQIKNISKSFINTERQKLLVLDNINFTMREGEIVALLGKSGSGKSTLLRIVAGLIKPSCGEVFFSGELVTSPIDDISMVFQSFALLPWLTVLENVELGLEAQGIPKKIRRQRALEAIDTIGLDGFESAYPKELSGGMKQRVGFARALVVQPKLLLMDEPFSALDILTRENLRNDLLDLWHNEKTRTKGILCVTHDIEEAIILANRIIIFASDPGTIQSELAVELPFPRDPESQPFRELLDKVYTAMTVSKREKLDDIRKAALQQPWRATPAKAHKPEYGYRIPEVEISELTGLLEAMEDHEVDGEIDLPTLAESLHLDVNNLFPLTEVLDMLRFAKIKEGELTFTPAGRDFAAADILKRKQIFADHLLKYMPLAKHISYTLNKNPGHRVHEDILLADLEDCFSPEESDRILRTIIGWGRYAEILAYDYDSGELSLENPQ